MIGWSLVKLILVEGLSYPFDIGDSRELEMPFSTNQYKWNDREFWTLLNDYVGNLKRDQITVPVNCGDVVTSLLACNWIANSNSIHWIIDSVVLFNSSVLRNFRLGTGRELPGIPHLLLFSFSVIINIAAMFIVANTVNYWLSKKNIWISLVI